MSDYPEPLSDIAILRQRMDAMQRELDEVQRGPKPVAPTLLFGTYAAMVAVAGKALQRAWVDMSTESVVGRRGEWVYRPGTGWVRPWITGEFVPYQGQSVPAFCLAASGGTYNVSDYPDLAAAYGVASGTFTVTNMGGRVIVGAGTVADANGTVQTFTQGTKGGEITHVMSEAELRNHFHVGTTNTANGKLYRTVYGAGSGSAANHQPGWNGSPGFDDRFDAGFAGADHTHNFQTSATGSSQPMSLMQPWQAVNVAIRF